MSVPFCHYRKPVPGRGKPPDTFRGWTWVCDLLIWVLETTTWDFDANMMKYLVGGLLGCSLLVASATAAAVTFSDSTFADPDWSSQQLILTGAFPSAPGATFSAGQVGSGGTPGAYREATQTYHGPNMAILVAHMRTASVYDPGLSGPVAGFNYSFDLNFFNFPGTCCSPSNAVGYAAVIEQGGNFYLGGSVVTVSASWVPFTITDQTAAHFVLLNGDPLLTSSHPDFSATGSAITFGYASANGTASASTTSTTSGLDNWVVSSIDLPEPSSLGLLALGLILLSSQPTMRRALGPVRSRT